MNIGRAQAILDAWKAGTAKLSEVLELREALSRIFDDAIAWRKGHGLLQELRARVMPCGHAMEDLIGGNGSITKCGQCLADKRAKTPQEETTR